MIIDMNYWSNVLKKLLIFALSVLGIYLAFKLAIFYMPFLIAFIIIKIILDTEITGLTGSFINLTFSLN